MALKDALARNGITSTDTSDGSSTNNDGGQNSGGNAGGNGDEGNEGGAGASGGAPSGSSTPTTQIDDDTLIKTLKERGIEVNNFEEIRTKFTPPAAQPNEPTEEEKKAAEEKRKAEARAFALRNNLVTTNTLDDFARETSMPYTDLGYQIWKQERTEGMTAEEIAAIDEQELVDEYHDEYSLYAEATDAKRIRKEKQLQSKVDAYLKEKYGNVYSLENEYEAHVADQQLRNTYSSNVSEAVKAIGDTLTFSIKEGDTEIPFSFKLPDGAIDQATQDFLSDASFTVFGKPNKLDSKAMTDVIKANLKSKYLDQIISYVATTHAQNEVVKAAKGRRGIPTEEAGTNQHQNNNQGGNKNPIMKRHLDEHSKQTGTRRQPATV